MKKSLFLAALAASLACTPALASGKKFTAYSVSKKSQTVKGSYLVDGYTPQQVMSFVKQDCAGAVSDFAHNGKPRKKKGIIYQRFTATCQGGLSPKFKGTSASIEVEQMPDGKHLAEIFTSDGSGNMVLLKEYRRP